MKAGRPLSAPATVPRPIALGELGETIRDRAKSSRAPTSKPLNSRYL